MNENADPAILIENIKRLYGRIVALAGVDMRVEKGAIFGLLGPNGAGKSTLIKVLVGSTRPNQGQVRVLGLNPFKEAQKLRGLIGYMPQTPALYEDLSARDNIRFFGAAHHLPDLDQQVNRVLDFSGLTGRAGDAVSGFSGGMKQRVSLACALVQQPRALFLDEPTAGVDPKLKEAFWQHFRELAAQGVTLFISTHLMDEALLCDRLAIMQDGGVLVCDTPKNIMLRGNTTVKVWRGDKLEQHSITEYPTQLPGILQKYGLDPSVTRLELEQDTLETIMLRLINAKPDQAVERPHLQPAAKVS
jgi:ABC-2 type transport system ATP-binding protein